MEMLNRTYMPYIIILFFLFFFGCAPAALVQVQPGNANSLPLIDISEGLPGDGLWRQNIALFDIDGDGFLDIVASPPRKAERGKNVPYIFLRNPAAGGWKEGSFAFPSLKVYDYGGVAAGDINGDGYPDIALAVHMGRIILLENNKGGSFVEKAFPVKTPFHSRMIVVDDINGDGRPDIIALSEAPFSYGAYEPKGILTGLNKDGSDWDVKIMEESNGLFGDSMAIGDINGDGNKDIIIAPLIHSEDKPKFIWFGDGKGNFKAYDSDLIGDDVMAFFVRSGDLDGDGKDEVVFKVSGFGKDAKTFLRAYRWTGAGFADISKGLERIEEPIVFDLADIDRDGKKELIVLSAGGLSIFRYTDKGWVERGYYRLSSAETNGAFDLEAGRNRDGSLLIVYCLGKEDQQGLNHGIRAYLLK